PGSQNKPGDITLGIEPSLSNWGSSGRVEHDPEIFPERLRVLSLVELPLLLLAAPGRDQLHAAQRHAAARRRQGAYAVLGEVGLGRGLVEVAHVSVVGVDVGL